jgi:hypothetical protein
MPVKKIDESGQSEETNAAGKIEVNGKEYSKEDIQNILNQQKAATEKTQKVAAVLSAAQKYGVDVDTYLAQAEGAFDVVSNLIQNKVIDEHGKIIQARKELQVEDKVKGSENEDLAKLLNLSSGETGALGGEDKIAAIVAKALSPHLEGINKLAERVSAVDRTQGDMIRLQLEDKLSDKYPNLSKSDISQVFGSAMNDKSKSLWEHAEMLSKVRTAELGELRKKHAEEFGVNIDEFDANKMKEQEAGGGAGVLFQGKKFSFNAKPGDENVIDPKKASIEFIERTASGS